MFMLYITNRINLYLYIVYYMLYICVIYIVSHEVMYESRRIRANTLPCPHVLVVPSPSWRTDVEAPKCIYILQ